MATEQFLVVTNTEDEQLGHVPFVRPHMDNELIVIDPMKDILVDKALSFQLNDNGPQYYHNGQLLDRVAAVWDRRPTVLDKLMLGEVHPDYYDYSRSAVREHGYQFYSWFPDALWVSDHFAVQKAELKSLQLSTAAKLGFAVPETLFTSDPEAAQRFVARQQATIVKPLSIRNPVIDDTMLLFFSSKVTPEDEVDYSHLKYAPSIFQRAIEADYDIRVTVVGEQVFAAAVIADIEKDLTIGVRDWRIGNHLGKLSIAAYDNGLSEEDSERCVSLVKSLGLRFGAIDMIRDKAGKLWFIEINPNGQWAFVEQETGQQIGKAMARLLLSGLAN